MPRDFFTLDDFDLSGRTVLLRVDVNSPIDPSSGRILNDARIREHLPTFRDLRHARVAVLAHQSRPGKRDFTTLEAHAERIGALLNRPVRYIDSLFGRHAVDAIAGMEPGDVVVLENTRMYAEEDALAGRGPEDMAKAMMVRRLAPLARYYVTDAFAAAHRAQPSLVGFAEALPNLGGRLMERELEMLGHALHLQERPKVAILGGIKADDSIAVAKHMLEANVVDKVLTTGVVANLFLEASGAALGSPTSEFIRKETDGYDAYLEVCREVLRRFPGRVWMPTDVALNAGGARKDVLVEDLPSDLPVQDIGLNTIARYAGEIRTAKAIVMNGPAGVFELEEFALGTREIFGLVAESGAFTVVGGGHTVAALERFGLKNRVNHVSTGGGALLRFLAGKPLPVVEALRRSHEKFVHLRRP